MNANTPNTDNSVLVDIDMAELVLFNSPEILDAGNPPFRCEKSSQSSSSFEGNGNGVSMAVFDNPATEVVTSVSSPRAAALFALCSASSLDSVVRRGSVRAIEMVVPPAIAALTC